MFIYPKQYDVIVVGGGHAGIEAALASARLGCQTLLLTQNADTIGQMSCNPAIGGLAKGHLVREIDALGGQMGKATDMTGIQFRMLNKRNGPAVWAPRAQCDKKAFQFHQKWTCESQKNLDVKQGQTSKILERSGFAHGVETTFEIQFLGRAIIITTGTFLQGLLHIGSNQHRGGRLGDPAANDLSSSLNNLGIKLGRLKTGTPPRLLKNTINYSKTQEQFGDDPVPFFTFWKEDMFHMEQNKLNKKGEFQLNALIIQKIKDQIPCHLTYTTEKTRDIILKNINKSPMYSGVIEGIGPRYCPSIEDKIVKFSDKERHQIFLEPEGIMTDEVYINGLSTCLPFDVQIEIVRSVIGCENAEIMRPAYAVEYDFAFPTQLHPWLETKVCQNLFLAGQINGTSGYEEAAAQGLMAGINAGLRIKNQAPLVLRRDQAYIGVLIDDLVTKGTMEPYRMFTSRAEHRLLLRQDNADLRLAKIGYEVGLLNGRNYTNFQAKKNSIEDELSRLTRVFSNNNSLWKILSRPEISYKDLPDKNNSLSEEVVQQVEIAVKYAGYIHRQEMEVEKLKTMEEKIIPADFDFSRVSSLRLEARQKLSQIRPATIGQAARISGVSPADISVLLTSLKRCGDANVKKDTNPECAENQNFEIEE